MKKELFYYWEHFCILNATLCTLTAITMLIFPQLDPTLRLSTLVNIFSLTLVTSQKMKTKLRYRFLIAISLIFILEPIWAMISIESLHPTPLFYFLASLVLGLLALANYWHQNRKKQQA
ncbi:hypothetical protein AB1I63_09365 [Streptococcus pneumoniae]